MDRARRSENDGQLELFPDACLGEPPEPVPFPGGPRALSGAAAGAWVALLAVVAAALIAVGLKLAYGDVVSDVRSAMRAAEDDGLGAVMLSAYDVEDWPAWVVSLATLLVPGAWLAWFTFGVASAVRRGVRFTTGDAGVCAIIAASAGPFALDNLVQVPELLSWAGLGYVDWALPGWAALCLAVVLADWLVLADRRAPLLSSGWRVWGLWTAALALAVQAYFVWSWGDLFL